MTRVTRWSRRQLLVGVTGATVWSHALTRAQAEANGSYTFLVLGLDTREENTDQRSDVIMLSRVDLNTGTVRTLSIPRDLYVEIPGYGFDKINAAYQIGLTQSGDLDWQAASDLTAQTIAANFGVTIDNIAVTDMIRFPAIVDAVGGVDVINPYDLGEPDAQTNLLYPEGPLHLDGKDALYYCRLRHQDGDGGRVMRQHLVLQALLVKLQEPGTLAKLPALVKSLIGANVRTDIPASLQTQLLALLPTLDPGALAFTNIEHLLWAGSTDAGAWIYQGDWSTLPGYVQAWLAGEASGFAPTVSAIADQGNEKASG